MKKNIWIISVLLFTGCSDFLDVEPQNLIIPEDALLLEEDLVTALHGAYAILNDDGFAMEYNVIGDASSDNGKIPLDAEGNASNPDRLPHAYNLNLSDQFTAESLWEEAYQVIAAVNNILERIEEAEFREEVEARVEAECRTLRALMHFSLTQVFAQDYNFTANQSHLAVPYVFESEPGSKPARNTMAELYTNALNDINTALPLFQTGGDIFIDLEYRTGDDMYFTSYWSALALRARMHFYATDYAAALTDANEILNNGSFSLEPVYTRTTFNNDGVVSAFVEEWYGVAPILESEAIFQLDVDEDDGNFANRSLIDIYTSNNGNAAHAIPDDLFSLYEPGDARLGWYAIEQTDWHVFKYPGGLQEAGALNADAHHFPVFRLTEFQLMAAEIEARNGNDAAAQALVLPITNRAGATAITSTGNTLIEDIITERRKELAYEGHRLYDLKRLQRGFVRNDCILTNGNCIVNYPTIKYAWPIPFLEVAENENIIQNDF